LSDSEKKKFYCNLLKYKFLLWPLNIISTKMTLEIGKFIERVDQLDSTNNYAASLLLTKRLPEGSVIVANSQLVGRGQTTNKWESEPDRNLTLSIILYPEFMEITEQFEISKAISLGIVDFLKDLVDDVSIKWPNDIYIGKGKVAGMLMEYSIRKSKISSCIVGIGLNVNQIKFVSDAPNPVSLSQITGLSYDLEDCLSILLKKIDSRYHQLSELRLQEIDKDYEQLLYQRGGWFSYSANEGDFEGKLLGVDENGLLMIETRNQTVLKFDYKQVSFKS
jgi:BirA family transcriptional regulator, biotin operon repressor / biotin---[acetyl-CoA-carboxylase] ligase